MSSYNLEVFEAVWPFRKDEYCFDQIIEYATTIQDNTGAIGLVSVPQLELMVMLRVRIECHRSCYVLSRQSHVFECN